MQLTLVACHAVSSANRRHDGDGGDDGEVLGAEPLAPVHSHPHPSHARTPGVEHRDGTRERSDDFELSGHSCVGHLSIASGESPQNYVDGLPQIVEVHIRLTWTLRTHPDGMGEAELVGCLVCLEVRGIVLVGLG